MSRSSDSAFGRESRRLVGSLPRERRGGFQQVLVFYLSSVLSGEEAAHQSFPPFHLAPMSFAPLVFLPLFSPCFPHPSSSSSSPRRRVFRLASYCPLAQNSGSVFNELEPRPWQPACQRSTPDLLAFRSLFLSTSLSPSLCLSRLCWILPLTAHYL